jgi:WD40 repeat protein
VFTRDDALLANAWHDGTVGLWRTSDGVLAHTLTGHSTDVYCIACSPAADVLLSCDFEGAVKVWDTATGAELHTLPRHLQAVTALAFDASGALAATGCLEGRIRLFDARAGWQPLHTLPVHGSAFGVNSLQFSPASVARGPLLACGSSSRSVKLWDVRDAREARLLHTLRGHRDAVRAVAFSPDGALLATGSDDATVNLWRVADGALLHTVPVHGHSVLALAFHPRDASVLATCIYGGVLTLWHL